MLVKLFSIINHYLELLLIFSFNMSFQMLIGKCSFREVPTVNELAKVYEQAYEPYIYKNGILSNIKICF